ncbi:RRQRL motif-containing zinc-binding protein [Phytomonospora sp. NPDC050363]|uniref:RRQRL motif-containing zinc-binding protein n=1 Tax=Phytomonospora sp. NPDC050363 TaxID=3155642 RepID=UPI003401E4D4
MPTYPYRMAPAGLATRRQLAAIGLTPGTSEPKAQIVWRLGARVAFLYDVATARPKRPATPAQLAALTKAMRARRVCEQCQTEQPYCVSTKYGACASCITEWEKAA